MNHSGNVVTYFWGNRQLQLRRTRSSGASNKSIAVSVYLLCEGTVASISAGITLYLNKHNLYYIIYIL